jgi:hypothetical protein
VTFDQSRGDEVVKVTAVCRLHREIPADANVKWLGLVVRRVGRRTTCQLQVTLEHAVFAVPKRPAGQRDPEHVRLGWCRSGLGIRVAYWPGGEVECPDRILDCVSYAESIASAEDKLHAGALRRLRKIAYLAGHRLTGWHRMESLFARAALRRVCEQYATHVLGDVRDRWRTWVRDRKARGEDLYAPMQALRVTLAPREAFAWWCYLWARKTAHLEQFAADVGRQFVNRRDAHYRAEAIRLATEFSSLTVDDYSIAKLKELEPLTLPGTGVRDLAQWQLHASAPGRFREILLEVLGPRGAKCERPGAMQLPGSARAVKHEARRGDADGVVDSERAAE